MRRSVNFMQQAILMNRLHHASDWIVSVRQSWVRPIVRGKTTADVEFGAKISISMVDGYQFSPLSMHMIHLKGTSIKSTQSTILDSLIYHK